MGILLDNWLLKREALKKQLGDRWRRLSDSKYRHFWDDYQHLEKLLSVPSKIQEDIKPEDLKGWTPVELHLSKQFQGVAWLNVGQAYFTDKRSTFTICRSWQNQNKPQPIWTPLDVLTTLQNISPGLKPKGFIFNVSKCGSTLLAKMLSSIPRNLVISEDGTINKSLMPNELMSQMGGFPEPSRSELFRGVISALGQPRLGVEENYIIRFSPFNILSLPFIKKVFPEVPWVFLYRHPLEVVVSDLIDLESYRNIPELVRQILNLSALDITRMGPEYSHLAKQILDFSASEIATMSDEEFLARRNRAYSQMAYQYFDNKNTLLINYDQLLSQSGLHQVINFFQLDVSDSEMTRMLDHLKFYSKENLQQKVYKDDRAYKQKIASQRVRDLIDRWAMEPYLKLEKMRQNARPF
jgi:hypothetical protein